MTNDFEAIKKATKTGWRSPRGSTYQHAFAARDAGLPPTIIYADKTDDTERQIVGHKHKAWFDRTGPLADAPMAFGKARAEAAARLICEAREYLRREENARTIGA
jgi:hypothetical protein